MAQPPPAAAPSSSSSSSSQQSRPYYATPAHYAASKQYMGPAGATPAYPQPQWTTESIHQWYQDPQNRQLYGANPQYKHLFDQYDRDWGKQRNKMTTSSAILLAGVTVAAGALGAKYLLRTIRQLKPGSGTPITDVNAAVNQMRNSFYEGGFDSEMSKREAALILGCRESATKERIMDRYRVLMKQNHPDLGGSPHISTKVNEAKELLSKTARSSDSDGKR